MKKQYLIQLSTQQFFQTKTTEAEVKRIKNKIEKDYPGIKLTYLKLK